MGVFSTPSHAILWAIYTELHGSATRGADLESGQLYIKVKVLDYIMISEDTYICMICKI